METQGDEDVNDNNSLSAANLLKKPRKISSARFKTQEMVVNKLFHTKKERGMTPKCQSK